jgi:hypothetical protein
LKTTVRDVLIAFAGLAMLATASCKSYKSNWIDADVENHTGRTIHELEVDYPSASFGINTLAPGGAMHYRFQIRGSGPVKVAYTFEDGKTAHGQGLNLAEQEHGHLIIRLFPQGKVDFVPNLEPAS